MANTDPASHPRHVLVAGDWHRHTAWAVGVVRLLPSLLPDEARPVVLHAGDFGIGAGGDYFLDELDAALTAANAKLLFVDGNHDDGAALNAMLGPDPTTPIQIRPTITWLPRGHRWIWHGKTWVALGGAVSVDRALLVEGLTWWPEETITEDQAKLVTASGRADVMLCHDAPSGVPLRLGPTSPLWALRDVARSERHRELMQEIVDEVKPELFLHGHYHLEHDTLTDVGDGAMRVVGLDRDGAIRGNYRVLDARTLDFRDPA